jgi:hypothetical protein
MSLHQRHSSNAMYRRRTLRDAPNPFEQSVILLPQQLSDVYRVPTALDRCFEIFWLESGKGFDGGYEGVAEGEVESMRLGKTDVLRFVDARGEEEVADSETILRFERGGDVEEEDIRIGRVSLQIG